MTPSATALESPSRTGVTELRRLPAGDRDLIDRASVGLEALQGKWKLHLIVTMARGIRRHSRLLDCLPGASKKVMTDCLRSLERDGLVRREIYAEVPVRVEYTLTPLGWSMTEAIMALGDWGETHGDEVASARQHFWMRGTGLRDTGLRDTGLRDLRSPRPHALAAM